MRLNNAEQGHEPARTFRVTFHFYDLISLGGFSAQFFPATEFSRAFVNHYRRIYEIVNCAARANFSLCIMLWSGEASIYGDT